MAESKPFLAGQADSPTHDSSRTRTLKARGSQEHGFSNSVRWSLRKSTTVKMLLSTISILAATFAFHKWHFVSSSSLAEEASLQDNVVDLGYAKYLGNHTTTFPNTVSYLGLPYAEPPVGEGRFRAPVPLNTQRVAREAGGKVVDARSYPDFCIQGALGAGDHGGAGSEDCLKINVYTPVGVKKGAKLPVLAYIHGGGYIFGNPANWPFEHWIQQSPNVVIVSIYYRLSGFGFLSTPEFADGRLGDLNAGFRDQIEALRWVQQHIDNFGGDPNKVTINGESAGGSSIELHLVASQGNEQLFSGAIAQSVYRTPLAKPEQQQPLFDAFSERAGCGSGSLEDKMKCLRSASISALAIAQDDITATLPGYHLFQPVLDNKIFVDYPTRLIQKGIFRKVPLIVGATTNETLSGGNDLTAELQAFFPSLADGSMATIASVYPDASFASDALRNQTITGDLELRCARPILGSAWHAAGINTWTYRYNQPDPTSHSTAVAHAAENFMMFRGTHTGVNGTTTFTVFNPFEVAFSEELIAYWLSFVRTFDPNTHKVQRAPVWPQYSAQQRNRVVLNEAPSGADVTTVSGSHVEDGEDEAERCDVVAGLVEQTQD